MFETISSAAWPLALVVIVFVFKKQFSSLLERNIQVKFGDKEVSLPTPELEVPIRKQLSEGVALKEEPSTQNQEELVAESAEKTSELSSQDGLFWKMVDSFSANDLEQAAVFFEELQKAGANSSDKTRNEMFYLYMRYKHGDFSSIEKL